MPLETDSESPKPGSLSSADKLPLWQDWRFVGALAALVFALSFFGWVGTTLFVDQKVEQNSQDIADLQRIAEDTEEIRAFVDEVRQNQEEDATVDLQIFIDLLCASTDPTRRELCERLEL